MQPLIFTLVLGVFADEGRYVEDLILQAQARALSSSAQWRALVHYEPESFGRLESTVDSPSFFLAANGKTDPEAELRETIRAFFAPPVVESPENQHPQCRFRARYLWLASELAFDPVRLAPQPCARFEWWRDRLGAESVTLVFASAYLNNPVSMFGHTFLRLNRAGRSRGSELTSYAVNFAANPTTSNPLFYAVLGLTGGFPGVFSTIPYYLKVREYASLEHRGLWEYDLAFSSDEVAKLVSHLWEMGSTVFDYYYLDENCSYHLLGLLEVVRPTLGLTRQFSGFVAPADTVRVVEQTPGLVGARRYRESQQERMLARRALLAKEDWPVAHAAATSSAAVEQVWTSSASLQRRAAILDAATELLRYRMDASPSDEDKSQEQRLLLARGRLQVQSSQLEIKPPAPPEAGHDTMSLAIGAGADARGSFLSVEGRLSLHDLLARPDGYIPGSQIEFFRVSGRFPLTAGAAGPQLEHLRVLSIATLTPVDGWDNRWSWRLSTGVERYFDLGCNGAECLFYEFRGGPGLAFKFGSRAIGFAFLDLSAGAGSVFTDSYRLGAGLSAGLRLEVLPAVRLLAEASYFYPALGEGRPKFLPGAGSEDAPFTLRGAAALDLSRNVELRLSVEKGRGYEFARGALWLYF